ncbi:MAG: hypothetical protein ACO1Q7_14425 [Gemmatimonas sp.]
MAGAQESRGYVFPTDSGYFRFIGNRIEGAFPRDTQDLGRCAVSPKLVANGVPVPDSMRALQWSFVHQVRPASGMHNADYLRATVNVQAPPGQVLTEHVVDSLLSEARIRITHGNGVSEVVRRFPKPESMSFRDGQLMFTIADSSVTALLRSPRNVSLRYSWCASSLRSRQIPIDYAVRQPTPRRDFTTTIGRYIENDSIVHRASLRIYQSNTAFGPNNFIRNRIQYQSAPPADWLKVESYAFDQDIEYGGGAMSAEADSNVVVFWAHSNTRGEISIQPMRTWNVAHIPSDTLISNGPVPRCNGGRPWGAAFFIEGVGYKPTQAVFVRIRTADRKTKTIKVDPVRNLLRLQPTFDFHTYGLHQYNANMFTVSAHMPPGSESTIQMVVNQSADGWQGFTRLYREEAITETRVQSQTASPLDLWRVYTLIDPNDCPK